MEWLKTLLILLKPYKLEKLKAIITKENTKDIETFKKSAFTEERRNEIKVFIAEKNFDFEDTIIWIQKFLSKITIDLQEIRLMYLYNLRYHISRLSLKEYKEFDSFLAKTDIDFAIAANNTLKKEMQITQMFLALDHTLNNKPKILH